MIPWLAWIFVAPLLVLLDGFLLPRLPLRCDLAAALVLCIGFACRGASLPGLLFALALARAMLTGGGLAAQYLALALPVAAMRPLRAVFDEGSWRLRALLAPGLAAAIPRLLELFAGLAGAPVDPLPIETRDLLAAVVVVPLLAAVFERVPPLSAFLVRARRRARGEA
ncbi:MAG: hypothetical protein IT457_09570 [Planctomycetes bacterium]|nr:hypothetical protein [Planctomycetota bacterium]